jgi:hypothetical protein
VSFLAIPDAVRLDNPKLMLWRELQQHGDEARQKSNKRWLVLGLRPRDHDSRMGFWRDAWTFAKSKSNVISGARDGIWTPRAESMPLKVLVAMVAIEFENFCKRIFDTIRQVWK